MADDEVSSASGSGTSSPSRGRSDAGGGQGTNSEEPCTPGAEGCECVDGLCLGDLVCLSELCVDATPLEKPQEEDSTGEPEPGSLPTSEPEAPSQGPPSTSPSSYGDFQPPQASGAGAPNLPVEDARMIPYDCPNTPVSSSVITSFSEDSSEWGEEPYAMSLTSYGWLSRAVDSGALSISGIIENRAGFGIGFDNCLDASEFTGVRFWISGAGVEQLEIGLQTHATFPIGGSEGDENKGGCEYEWSTMWEDCVENTLQIPLLLEPTLMELPFVAFSGGVPESTVDPAQLLGIHWRLWDEQTLGQSIQITVDGVEFY